jgi:hypothetical protein
MLKQKTEQRGKITWSQEMRDNWKRTCDIKLLRCEVYISLLGDFQALCKTEELIDTSAKITQKNLLGEGRHCGCCEICFCITSRDFVLHDNIVNILLMCATHKENMQLKFRVGNCMFK